jgi:hypothetical protein
MVPAGVLFPVPFTVRATKSGMFTAIDLLAGETVRTGFVLAGLPPPVVFIETELQPIAENAIAAVRKETLNLYLRFLLLKGTKKITKPSRTDPPAASNHLESIDGGSRRLPAAAAIVFTDAVADAVDTAELKDTEAGVSEQVGTSVAPLGEEVSAQLKLIVPVKPLLPVTDTEEDADAPGAIVNALVADRVKVGVAVETAVTVMGAVPVAGA